MDCDAIRPKLTAMRDGELTAAETRECERHLESCAACSQIVHQLQSIRASPPAPPDEFDIWEAVQAQIAPDIQTLALLAEMRAMREDMRVMREEMRALALEAAALRQALPKTAPPVRSTALDLPYVRKSIHSPFQLV